MRRNYLHILWRVPALALWMLFMPLLFYVLRFLRIPLHTELPHYFHRGVQIVFGLKVSFSGEDARYKPTLYVSNHASYLDVFVLGGIRGFFIAKSEVARWPVLGPFAKFQNTLFFERSAGKARHQLDVMQSHLHGNISLILFPEGTSTEGTYVEPFKSSLFEAANMPDGNPRVAIQPITLAYTHYAGRPMDKTIRDNYAWYAKMPFGAHFKSLFSLKRSSVKVHFHPVCYLDEFDTRKQCAEHCHALIETKLKQLIVEGDSA